MPRSAKSYKMTCAYESACSDDYKLVACVGGRVNVFDIERRQKVASLRPFPYLYYAAFSPDSRSIAIKNTLGRIAVSNLSTGELLCDHKNQKEGEGSKVSFSPDGELLIDASWDGTITVRKAFEPTIVSREENPGEHVSVISHDANRSKWLFRHQIKLQEPKKHLDPTRLILRDWPFEDGVFQRYCYDDVILWSAALSPDATRICVIAQNQKSGRLELQIIRAINGKIVASVPIEQIIVGEIAWLVGGGMIGLELGYKEKSRFVFYRSSDLSMIGEVPCQYPSSICFLGNSDQVVLGSWQFSRLARLEDFLSGEVKMRK
jgi:WD40 repeat protein